MMALEESSKAGFKDPHFHLAWIINGSNVCAEYMFGYILQPCLGQMASIMQGRPTGFLARFFNTSPYSWTSWDA